MKFVLYTNLINGHINHYFRSFTCGKQVLHSKLILTGFIQVYIFLQTYNNNTVITVKGYKYGSNVFQNKYGSVPLLNTKVDLKYQRNLKRGIKSLFDPVLMPWG